MVTNDPHGQLYAGAAEVDVTPPVGVPLAGYGAREQNSSGIHDPLKAQVLYIQHNSKKFLLITCDLIGIDLNFTTKLRNDIHEQLNISPDHIMVACSHTHSGPQGFLPDEPIHVSLKDEGLVEITRLKIIGAALWAVSEAEPTTLSFSDLELTGIGKNRNDPDHGPIDPRLSVIRFNKHSGEPLAVFFNYGCHPTVMGYTNLQITADLPGAARRALKKHFPACVFSFTNGASGDVSTRFTRREQSFAEVDRLGLILASGVLEAMMKSTPVEISDMSGERITIELPQKQLPPKEEIKARIKNLEAELKKLEKESAPHGMIRKVITQLEGARGQLLMLEEKIDASFFITEMQFLKLGPIFFVGIPGEPFSQTVLDIKESCASSKVIVVSYANDNKGYFPDQLAIENDTYEALISPLDRRVSDLIYQLAVDHCQKG